jgi:hypothetical protein
MCIPFDGRIRKILGRPRVTEEFAVDHRLATSIRSDTQAPRRNNGKSSLELVRKSPHEVRSEIPQFTIGTREFLPLFFVV